MKTSCTIVLSAVAGIAVGAAAVQALHAQATPPAYTVAEFVIHNPQAFQEFSAENMKGVTAAGGRFIVLIGKRVSHLAGVQPRSISLVGWDNFEQARAYYNSDTWKNLAPIRDKGAMFRAFLVEGAN